MALMECPKCGFQQDEGEECLRCGVLFAKAHPEPPEPGRFEPSYESPAAAVRAVSPIPAAASPVKRRSRPPTLLSWLFAAMVLLVLWVGWSGGPRSQSATAMAAWDEGAGGYRQALEQQTLTDQPMVVYFYTDWCPYCRQLERELLSQTEVEGYLQGVIKVRINPEKGADESRIARSFGVRGYPSLFAKGSGGGKFVRVERGIRDGSRVRLQTPTEFVRTLRTATGPPEHGAS